MDDDPTHSVRKGEICPQLTLIPENDSNSSIICSAGGREEMSLRKRRVSSAYNDILSVITPTWIPFTEEADLIRAAMGSMANANKPGDSGQPCLVPLDRGNGMDSELFARIRAVGL